MRVPACKLFRSADRLLSSMFTREFLQTITYEIRIEIHVWRSRLRLAGEDDAKHVVPLRRMVVVHVGRALSRKHFILLVRYAIQRSLLVVPARHHPGVCVPLIRRPKDLVASSAVIRIVVGSPYVLLNIAYPLPAVRGAVAVAEKVVLGEGAGKISIGGRAIILGRPQSGCSPARIIPLLRSGPGPDRLALVDCRRPRAPSEVPDGNEPPLEES